MKLRPYLFYVTLLTAVSVACNLPLSLQGPGSSTVSPTLTQPNKTAFPNPTSTPTVTPTSPLFFPSPTTSGTPFPTSDLRSTTPTFTPTITISVKGMGSATQTTATPFIFAPTADPQKIFVGSCGTNQTTITVMINQPEIVGSVLLFDRLEQLPNGTAGSFGGGTTMKAISVGEYQATITAPSAKPVGSKAFNTKLDYKFVVLDIAGKIEAGSFIYSDIAVTVCKP